MDKISDEIRNFVARSYRDEYMDPKELLALADRIDAEMVELPKDRDKKPIHVGDTLYSADSSKYCVSSTELFGTRSWHVFDPAGKELIPSLLSHTRPDSLKCLADELDEWCKDAAEDRRIRASDADALLGFSERIKKLASERDDEQDDE